MKWLFKTRRQLYKALTGTLEVVARYQDTIAGYQEQINRRDTLIEFQRLTMAEMREKIEELQAALCSDLKRAVIEAACGTPDPKVH
jgi:hypothetical protein